MNQDTKDKLIARYVAKGGNAERGAELLQELLLLFSPANLAYALVYNGFGTERQVAKLLA